MRLSPARIWRTLRGAIEPVSRPEPVPRMSSFRDGDTFVPERILSMDEPLAVLHATSQALACCALASRRVDLGDGDTVPVASSPANTDPERSGP